MKTSDETNQADLYDIAYADLPRICEVSPHSQKSASGAIVKSLLLCIRATEGQQISADRLAEMACCSSASVYMALRFLIDQGIIIRDQPRRNRSPRYRVSIERLEEIKIKRPSEWSKMKQWRKPK